MKNYADERELTDMVNELLGIQYNITKANRTDRKVQNLASYINADTLRAIHKTMDRRKAYGIYLSKGTGNVLAESVLLAMAKNVNKFHNKIQKGRTGTHLFKPKSA